MNFPYPSCVPGTFAGVCYVYLPYFSHFCGYSRLGFSGASGLCFEFGVQCWSRRGREWTVAVRVCLCLVPSAAVVKEHHSWRNVETRLRKRNVTGELEIPRGKKKVRTQSMKFGSGNVGGRGLLCKHVRHSFVLWMTATKKRKWETWTW